MKKLFLLLLLPFCGGAFAQKSDSLTVEKIMRDPKWMGISPYNISWSDDSKKIYFDWNPEQADRSELYSATPPGAKPQKVSISERSQLGPNNGLWFEENYYPPTNGKWNSSHTAKLYEKNGDIWLFDLKTGTPRQLTNTADKEESPSFSGDGSRILFTRGDNLYSLALNSGQLVQLTNFIKGEDKKEPAPTLQAQWLKNQQLELFDIIKLKDKNRRLDSIEKEQLEPKKLKEIYLGNKQVSSVGSSPDGRFIAYRLTQLPDGAKRVNVPNYVTASGFTEDIPNRTKVGAPQATSASFIFDTQKDTVYSIRTGDIPGIKDIPAYFKDYPEELAERTRHDDDRKVDIGDVYWSSDGKNAVVEVVAQDNKDRWIMKLDPANGGLTLLDREHNDAWIGGPGTGNLGWIDNARFYYESEASGYAHIYIVNVADGSKKQLTSGKWEVQTLRLSNDKKTFYFTANIDHPGITHFYRIPVTGGEPVKLTSMRGGNEVLLSPDEKWLAISYSYTNKPWELYIQPNRPGAKAIQVTSSTTAEFKAYPWRDPQVITFKNRYGSDVYARLYLPEHPHANHPAVVFVHGAGYLQNADFKWSHYFREYLFDNLLADNGYAVLDMDYSGSSGYGRDWRTAIYRHMGGKDLTDQVDGVQMLIEKYGVNPKYVGMYGGSYGGFMTLMALFTQPEVFASGAAIRSVADWAHYNNGYTSNILNYPYTDEKAYHQSSPVNFANGLKGNLLMLHGMVDQNVNYQDIIRLTQRLIELHKENWELASYPVENHGFVQPSSWTDEYKRIFKLFEQTLKK